MPLTDNEPEKLPEIEAEDFVNDGRGKFNYALGFITKSYGVDQSTGELVVTRYNGKEFRLKLANFFALLDDVAEYLAPGMADTENPGLMLLADPDDPKHLTSTQRVLSAAGVNQLIELLKASVPTFNTDGWEVGDIFTVQQNAKGEKYLKATDPDDFFQSLLKNISSDTRKVFCQVASSCDTGGSTDPVTVTTWNVLEQYVEVDDIIITPPLLTARASVDINDCDQFAGWVYSSAQYPAVIRIEVDGEVVAYETAKVERKDVRDYLIQQGVQTANTIFQYNYIKPSKWRDGQKHVWRAFVGDSMVEATDYNAPKEKTCAAPVDNTPYVVSVKQSIINSLNKGGSSKTVSLIELLNNGQERPYSGSIVPVWSVAGSPAGIVFSPYDPNKTVDVVVNSDATVDSFKLQCSLTLPQTVQVITVGCNRPSNLFTFKASYHFVPNGGYSDPPYPTLDVANTTAGKHFDGSRTGNLDLFTIQVANLNKGTPVFLGDGTSCEKAGDNIYSVFGSDGENSVKKAIQVGNGVIVDVKDSTYSSGPNNAPVRNFPTLFLTAVEDLPFGGNFYTFASSKFTDPDGDALTWSMEYSSDGGQTWGAMPAWANFNANTREFSGTGQLPTTANRTYNFRLKVEDSRGGVAYDPFALQTVRQNYALASRYGATATASSTYSGFDPNYLLNGFDRAKHDSASWGNNEGWNSAIGQPVAGQWVEIDLKQTRSVGSLVVTTLPDDYQSETPTGSTFTTYGVTGFRVQVPDGSGWRTVATVSGNTEVHRVVTFANESCSRLRIVIDSAADDLVARLLEIEVYNANIQ